jgi:radical SAM superfamily enzyme YgiQ (UPF0313 family)
MKLLFVLPAIGKKDGEKYIGTWKMEPLTIATLKAQTPGDVETAFFDDRIEDIDYAYPADLVAVSVETYTAGRAYAIARRFRERGATVVMGGYHASAAPDEAGEHADCVVVGNAEGVWKRLLDDFAHGGLLARYAGEPGFSGALPDRSIYENKKYLPLSLVETGRGCPHSCEFCSITSYYCGRYFPRPIEQIVAEIKTVRHKIIFFVDDNVSAQKAFLKDLCRAVIPLKIKWTSQASLSVAQDGGLLELMKKSGCQVLLIGFESVDRRNLDQMGKSWNYTLGARDELIRKIHSKGRGIYATVVFGFDFDGDEGFEETVAFAMKHKFFFAAFNHLLPFPGTPLYARLLRSGRLLCERWWLKDGYKYGDIPYEPRNIGADALKARCAAARREFFRPMNILRRGLSAFRRNANLVTTALFFSQNFALMREVDRKLNLPVGSGLDGGGAK